MDVPDSLQTGDNIDIFDSWDPLDDDGQGSTIERRTNPFHHRPRKPLAKDLRRHERIHRPAEHAFYCDHAGCPFATRGFARKDHLVRHKRTHEVVIAQPQELRMSQSSENLSCNWAKSSFDELLKDIQDDFQDDFAFTGEHYLHPDVDSTSKLLSDTHSQKAHTVDPLTQPSQDQRPELHNKPLALEEELDANDSDYADSIFSQESTASTATTLDGSTGTASRLEMVNRMASMVFCSEDIHRINVAAVNDLEIGPERFRRNLRRMIKILGQELRAEARDPLERSTAVALQTRSVSTRAAHRVLIEAGLADQRHTRASEPSDEVPQSDVSIESTDEDQDSPDEKPEDETRMYQFILGSMAYDHLKKRLLLFAHEPYEKRLLAALSGTSTGGVNEVPESVSHIARELSWVPPHLLSFSEDRSLGLGDRIKGFIENTMEESWDWSPFRERQHRLKDDWFRLSWKSPNKRTRHIDLPLHVRAAFEDTIHTAPAFLNQPTSCSTHTRSSGGSFSAAATGNPSPSAPLPLYHSGGRTPSPFPMASQTPWQPAGTSGSAAPSGLQLQALGAHGIHNDQYVYLCIEARSRHFVGLDCNNLQNDVQFFQKIKAEYNSARGWFRLWFSTWHYDYCEFFRFQNTGLGLGARLEIAFPEPADPLYEYYPKPLHALQLPPHGPISHDEFHLHYYHRSCPSLFSWDRWHRRQISPGSVEKEALEAAPKRLIRLNMRSGKREHFYGLYAKEVRSAQRVAIHMSVCCLPGVIFFFLWLYQWGHGADLQGAAVPVQLSLTLVAGYLGVLYWTR